ncbi:gluconolactonase precursor [Fusarium albosuccineum]|uniref:Gluconolactonase n=1 Tax=Fusarium albosuccineum TaxID=1237068 RepID=A0A8H4PJ37_9HYPO|nr:gluconolactonase precursor [Fusarium albosuccineum]
MQIPLSLISSLASVVSFWGGRPDFTTAIANFQRDPSIYEVPIGIRNVFPANNFNRDVNSAWWHTDVLDGHSAEAAGQVVKHLNDAVFVVLDQDFYEAIEQIFDFPSGPTFAKRIVHDGTVYSPECKCIFFAELHPPKQGYSTDAMSWVWRVNLNNTPPTTDRVFPSPQLTVPDGAYYHNGSVYWAHEGNYTVPGGIVRMDPLSLRTEVVLNNFFGHRFNNPNDITITHDSIAYFTDGYYGYDNFNDTLKPEHSNGVYRWNMKTGDLQMILGAGSGHFTNPNGVALSPNDDHLHCVQN